MKRTIVILPLCFLLLLAACNQNGGQGKRYSVYYAASQPFAEGTSIKSEEHRLLGSEQPVKELMALVLGKPSSDKLICPIPSGVSVIDWSLQDGVLRLKLSEGYGGLSGIDLTIADYCITLTMCQLDEVRSVAISVEGDLIPTRYYQTLHSSDVLLSAMEDDPVSITVDLYFPRSDGTGLSTEKRDVITGDGMTRSSAVINALIEGPKSSGLSNLMPEGVELRSTLVKENICYVDFSAAFGESPIAETKEGALLLYGIVDTLCRLSGIEEVQLLVGGEAPVFYGGVPTLTPLEPDFSLAINN